MLIADETAPPRDKLRLQLRLLDVGTVTQGPRRRGIEAADLAFGFSRGLIGAAVLGLLAMTAAYAQATINDCEKIQAADAYNQCLAKFGPPSKVQSVEPVKPGDIKASSADAAAAAGPAKGSGRAASRRRGRSYRHVAARKHISFSVRRRRHR